MGLTENLKLRGLKDIFSTRVFAYIESLFQKLSFVIVRQKDAVAYAEQIIFKRAMCSNCYLNKTCLHCGCNFEDLSVSKIATCSNKRWGKVLRKKEWEEYKNKYLNGIDFGMVKQYVKYDENE